MPAATVRIASAAIGRLGDGWVVSSETCALRRAGCGVRAATWSRARSVTIRLQAGASAARDYSMYKRHEMCAMEYIYFAPSGQRHRRPQRPRLPQGVGTPFLQGGPAEAAVIGRRARIRASAPRWVMPRRAASPYEMGLIKNKYIGRTFIQPTQELREKGVRMELSAVRSIVRGKRGWCWPMARIVRGTTSRRTIRCAQGGGSQGARAHRQSSDDQSPCFYGVDTSTLTNLISARKNPRACAGDRRRFAGIPSRPRRCWRPAAARGFAWPASGDAIPRRCTSRPRRPTKM